MGESFPMICIQSQKRRSSTNKTFSFYSKKVTMFRLLILSFMISVGLSDATNPFERFKSPDGYNCHTSCEMGKDAEFWCGNGGGGGMRCSPDASTTIKGEACLTECEGRLSGGYLVTSRTHYCQSDLDTAQEDLCGPTVPPGDDEEDEEFRVTAGFNFNDRFKSTNGYTCYSECTLGKGGKHWCRSDTATQMHCSPAPRTTYKGDSCTTDCVSYSNYYYCYTDYRNSSWDYCGPTEPEPPLPTIRLTPEELEKGGLLRSDIEQLISSEDQAISALETLKSRILRAHRDYSIAKTVGSSASSVGAVAAIAGMALAPVTGGGSLALTAGSSLALTAGGVTTTLLGAGTSLTTGIVETVKMNEWADELRRALAPREEHLRKIGLKIINHPTWEHYVGQGASGLFFVATKTPSAILFGKMIHYFAITVPQYGLHRWPAYYFAASNLPAPFLVGANHFISKGAARLGIRTVGLVGVGGLKLLGRALGVGAVGYDIYTIVATWTSNPSQVKQIDKIIGALRESTGQLNSFKSQFS